MTRDFVVCALLCLFFLLLPIVSCTGLIDRQALYKTMDQRRSIELAHYQQIYEESSRLSVAFVGLSSMWVGVDAKRLQDYMSERTGDDHNVIMLGANHPGEDLVYMLAKDLLSRRAVDLLILSAPNRVQQHPHPMFHRLASVGEHGDVWSQLSLPNRLTAWALAAVGTPLQIFNQFVTRVPPSDNRSLVRNNGSWVRSAGWNKSKFERLPDDQLAAPSGDVQVGQVFAAGSDKPVFSSAFSDYQEQFFRSTVEMARQHGTRVAVLSTPIWRDRSSAGPVVRIEQSLLEELAVPILGVVPKDMFVGKSDEEIQRYFYNGNHFNTNGALWFTNIMSPAILELHSEPLTNE